MLRAIKIKLYLSKEQETYANKLLGSCRFVYNKMLEYKINEYTKNKKSIGISELGKFLTNIKNEYDWLRDSHSKVLQQSMINLESAYKNFFRSADVGFPKFKSKSEYSDSARFPKDAIGKIKGNRITIIKQLNNIHFKCSRRDERFLNKNKDCIKSATLTKTKTNEYFLSILVDAPIENKLPTPKNDIIGIDVGIKDFVITSKGDKFENIKTIRNNEKKLKRLQKQLSKKQMVLTGEYKFSKKWNKDVEIKKPSKNREKARLKLAKYNNKLKNKKENYLHYVVNQLLNDNQVIVIENLNVSGMLKNHNLAKSVQELSLYRFKQILNYKAVWYDRTVIEVDRFFASSKTCSCCGAKKKDLKLSDRVFKCDSCGNTMDRDENAANNLEKEGERILKIGLSESEYKLVENGSVDDPFMLKSIHSMKQEDISVRGINDKIKI
jgi:putative transposase